MYETMVYAMKISTRLLVVCVWAMWAVLMHADVSGADVHVLWDSNKESDISGYVVYYGTRSRMYAFNKDVGNKTECIVTALPDTGVYYFSVRAYDNAGNESSFSDESVVFLSKDVKRPFSMYHNYPNPFNPVTTIPYHLQYDLNVKICVYDIRGRLVKVLHDGPEKQGAGSVEWDGTNMYGASVASGVYICRIIVGNFSQTRKINLLH